MQLIVMIYYFCPNFIFLVLDDLKMQIRRLLVVYYEVFFYFTNNDLKAFQIQLQIVYSATFCP